MARLTTIGDIAVVALPAFTALGGAYSGARLQMWTGRENELRQLLDRGTAALPQIALRLGWARAFLERQGPNGSGAGRGRLEELDEARVHGEVICDLIFSRAGPDSAVYVHFVESLRAAERARDEMIRVADMASGEAWDRDASLRVVDGARAEFGRSGREFLKAAHERMTARRFTWLGSSRRSRAMRMVGEAEP